MGALDAERCAVVIASLASIAALVDDPCAVLRPVRVTPPDVRRSNARAGFTMPGPNLGSYRHADIADEWADVGEVREDLVLVGVALPVVGGAAVAAGGSGGGREGEGVAEEEVFFEHAGSDEEEGGRGGEEGGGPLRGRGGGAAAPLSLTPSPQSYESRHGGGGGGGSSGSGGGGGGGGTLLPQSPLPPPASLLLTARLLPPRMLTRPSFLPQLPPGFEKWSSPGGGHSPRGGEESPARAPPGATARSSPQPPARARAGAPTSPPARREPAAKPLTLFLQGLRLDIPPR